MHFQQRRKLIMSTNSKELTEEATPTYLGWGGISRSRTLTEFNNARVSGADYHPVWLDNLADDVTLEGSMMDGAVKGPEAVRSIVGVIRTLYENQEFNFAGPYEDNAFVEVYSAGVRGEPIGGVVLVSRNAAGQAEHIVAGYRPRSTVLLLSRLLGDHFAGTSYGEHFLTGED
jgi:hypothetical protein